MIYCVGLYLSMSFSTVAAHLAAATDLAIEQLIRTQRLRDNVVNARFHRGHERRHALEQATWGAANLEVAPNNLITNHNQALQELILLRQHCASHPEIGRIFRVFNSIAAFHGHPARTMPGPIWPRHRLKHEHWCVNPEDRLEQQCSYGYWHQDVHGNLHIVYVFRMP